MDPFQLWQEDYRREVEDVISQLRAAAQGEREPRVRDLVVPPAGVYRDLIDARERLEKLTAMLLEAKARLERRGEEAAVERRQRAELKETAERLFAALKLATAELETTKTERGEFETRAEALERALAAAMAQRDMNTAEVEAARQKLADVAYASAAQQKGLREAAVEREKLAAELEQARAAAASEVQAAVQRTHQSQAGQRRLEAKIAVLEESIKHREQFVRELQERLDATLRLQEAGVSDRNEKIRQLEAALDRARAEFKAAGARGAKELSDARAEKALIWTESEALNTKLQETLKELESERAARVDDQQKALRQREAYHGELEHAQARRMEVERSFRDVAQELERQRAETEEQRHRVAEGAATLLQNAQKSLEEIESARRELAQARAECEDLRKAPADAEKKLMQARAAWENEKAGLEARVEEKISGARAKYDAELDRLKKELAETGLKHKAELSALRMKTDAEVRKAGEASAASLVSGAAGLAKEKAELAAMHQAELRAVRMKADEEIRKAGETAAALLAKEDARAREEREARERFQMQGSDLHSEQEALRARIEGETEAALKKAEAVLQADVPSMPIIELVEDTSEQLAPEEKPGFFRRLFKRED